MRSRLLTLGVAGFSWLILNPAARAQNHMIPSDFNPSYCYTNDDLGAVYQPEATSLKVWAPTAKQVRLLLFHDGTTESFQTIPMTRDSGGIWSADLKGNMDGRYYLYEVTHLLEESSKPVVYRVNDPYARGCSANSGRTLIYDPRETNPEDWDQDHFVTLKNNTDAVLYEAHIRDFSINNNSGVADGNRGSFEGAGCDPCSSAALF